MARVDAFALRSLFSASISRRPRKPRASTRRARPSLDLLEERVCLSTIGYWRFEEGIPNVPAQGHFSADQEFDDRGIHPAYRVARKLVWPNLFPRR
jgi:hypothetical protein